MRYRPMVIGVSVLLASANERCVGKVLPAAAGKLLQLPSGSWAGMKRWSGGAPAGRTPRMPLDAVRARGCSRLSAAGARLAARPFGQNA